MRSKYNCGSVFIRRKIHINLSVCIGHDILHAIGGFAHIRNGCLYSEFIRQIYHRTVNRTGSVGHAGKHTFCCFHAAAGNGNRAGGTATSASDVGCIFASGCGYSSPTNCDITSGSSFSTADSRSAQTSGSRYCSSAYGDISSVFVPSASDSRSKVSSGCCYLSSVYRNIASDSSNI